MTYGVSARLGESDGALRGHQGREKDKLAARGHNDGGTLGPMTPTRDRDLETSATGTLECRSPWLGDRRGYLSDWITQRWVQLTGRRVRLEDAPWLAGPRGSTAGIGDDFYDRLAEQLS